MTLLFKLLGRLPLAVLRTLGLALGWKIWLLSPRYRRATQRNWRTALESGRLGLDAQKAGACLRASIGHAGLLVTELPKIWCDPKAAHRMRITGLAAISVAMSRGRGVILLTPHLGAFELSPRAFALHHPITVLYRPARQPMFRNLMESLRPMPGLATAPATAGGVRCLLRALKKGEAIGMLPDQVPSDGEGQWADFFGKPAYTMTLPIRLAQATGAAIFWALSIRTRSGWHLDFQPWEYGLQNTNASMQTLLAKMNEALEAQIARAPDQYLWAYNRYKVPQGAASAPSALPESM